MDNEFSYFYGTEADSYSFYRIPKQLIVGEQFRALSNDAKLLYGLMLDRMSLSLKNGWIDGEKRVFIYYSMEDVMEDLACSKNKALKSLGELDSDTGIGLIERVKQGQGKPTIIYVKNFVAKEKKVSDFPKKEVKTPIKGKSRVANKGSQDFPKRDTNNTNINNTEYSDTESNLIISSDCDNSNSDEIGCDRGSCALELDVNEYASSIRERLEIELMIDRYPSDADVLEGLYELVLDTVLNQADSIVIASCRYPMSLVRSKLMKLNSGHIQYALSCMKSNTTKVRNIKKYMLATLFNAPATMGSYYSAEMNHDFPQYVNKN